MKQTLYICGDSFCTSDTEYGDNWSDMLAKSIPNLEVVNLSMVAASNYQIYLQVDHALKNNCDYLIYNATGSTRHEFSVRPVELEPDSINRYINIINPTNVGEILCSSWVNVWDKDPVHFTNKEISLIREFFTKFVDLSSMIEKNFIFIKYTLDLISKSNIKSWAWSQGGFEHPTFNPIKDWDFSNYRNNEIKINLWDYYDPTLPRPYFHVTDKDVLQKVCNYYIDMLQLKNV
mgnify:CR=1 FL=1